MTLPRDRAGLPRRTLALGTGLAVLLHGLLLTSLWVMDPPAMSVRPRFAQVRLKAPPPKAVEKAAPEPAPAPAPAPAPVPEPVPKPVPKPAEKPKPDPKPAAKPTPAPAPKPPAPAPAPTPAPTPPPAPAPAPKRSFSASMEAVSGNGRVAVPVTAQGDTWGRPDEPGGATGRGRPQADPGPGGTGTGPATPASGTVANPAEAATLTRLPQLASRPSDAEIRAAYPEAARREGLEADVKFEILIDEKGRVARVRLVKGAGNGFDEAAEKLVRRHVFKPGTKGNAAAATWIPWTLKFRLDN